MLQVSLSLSLSLSRPLLPSPLPAPASISHALQLQQAELSQRRHFERSTGSSPPTSAVRRILSVRQSLASVLSVLKHITVRNVYQAACVEAWHATHTRERVNALHTFLVAGKLKR